MRDQTDTTGGHPAELSMPAQPPDSSGTDLRTFLIADIRQYTTYTRDHGDEAGAALAKTFGELVDEVVSARDGILLELRGDEALVVFVSARKALRAAVDLQDRFAEAKLPRGVGIGLDAGEAVPVGAGYRGTALNLAARLCSKAAAGETLASETVIHLAAKVDGIAYVDARDLKIKGFGGSIRAVGVMSSDRAKGHRIVADGRSPVRTRAMLMGVAAAAGIAILGVTFGGILLNRPSPTPAVTPGATQALSIVGSSNPASPPTAVPTPDPMAIANLPVLAFYDAGTGQLKGTTSFQSPRNIAFFAGGSFWILANNQFNRIDANTHAVTSRVNVPIDEPNGFAWDDDYMWVTDLAGPRVVRIDQRSGTSETFEFGADATDTAAATDVSIGGGSVWLARGDIPEITRIDQVTGEVQDRMPVTADGMTYGADALWYWAGGSIGRIDPATDKDSFDPVVLSNQDSVGNIYFAGNDAWTATPSTGSVYRVDSLGRHTTYALDPGVGEMAAATEAMWITNANTGALTGIDLVTGQPNRTIETGHATIAVAAGNSEIMVAVGPTVEDAIGALPGSVLTVATDGIPFWNPGPDPPINGDRQVRQALYLTCANLLIHPDRPGPDGLELVPEAAASLPVVSTDGLTYTFTIRAGLKFSPPSDEDLTAETFRYSLERAVSPVWGDDVPGPRLFGDIAGVQEYRAGTADHVTGLGATGDELTIKLVAPAPDILARLATSFACPVPTKGTPVLSNGISADADPPISGTGPYYIAQTVRKRLVVLKKNPNYGGNRPQPFDAIAFRLQVAPDTALQMIDNGQIDTAMFDGGNPLTGALSQLADAWGPDGTKTASADQRWFAGPGTAVDYLALNPTRPVFQDPTVRHAVALALDREAISRIWVTGPTAQLLVPSVLGTDPSLQPMKPDVEAALALMDGRTLDLNLLGYPEAWDCGECRDFQSEVVKDLQAINVNVTVVPADADDYPGSDVFDPGSKIDLVSLGTGSDYSDPVSMLGSLGDVPWIGESNLAELGRLKEVGGQPRIDGIEALTKLLVDEQFLVIPTGYLVYPFFTSERVGCGFVQPAIGGVDLLSLCVKNDSAGSPIPSQTP